jgi:cytidylate kinase
MAVLAAGGDLDDPEQAAEQARSLDLAQLENPALIGRAAGDAASRVAFHPPVRAALLRLQKDFADQPGGAVLDGRDIGTVIAPDADVKIFVTADPEVRARRRWMQLTGRGEVVAFETILDDIRKRDARDADRDAAPMMMAQDAVLLDTTDLAIEPAFEAARRIVEEARARKG